MQKNSNSTKLQQKFFCRSRAEVVVFALSQIVDLYDGDQPLAFVLFLLLPQHLMGPSFLIPWDGVTLSEKKQILTLKKCMFNVQYNSPTSLLMKTLQVQRAAVRPSLKV